MLLNLALFCIDDSIMQKKSLMSCQIRVLQRTVDEDGVSILEGNFSPCLVQM